ncbi:nucleotidyltransferase family protein [Methanoculleus horonobensis]|jgi:predicted nucleotidyltransferase|uniref:nucleotidyltransferase family protein n=1 Tax=Methanoculleus horonobensis TaxID=528314 RepID=UPI00082BD25F|nr:nucleotidyltransferase domain-containing protein [Methanoculleus horonobensis]MDD3070404.1 nucleotidyltransferase domain-containing protein [Methanoculleus horonobensis]MDD4252032.1 nucleotidyltransferase domain-containing protein [Methanoculleus horonobensis]
MKAGVGILERVMAERNRICEIAARHGARNVRIFGSVVRGEAEAESDLDLLLDLEPDRSLLDLVALKSELEALLGIPVDVAEPVSLHWYIRDRVMAEAVPL